MLDWSLAWQRALYGPGGFFARGERPADHFRTAPLVGPELAEALVELLTRADTALDHPGRLDVVDVGAGGGELADAVHDAAGALSGRLRITAVEVAPRVGARAAVEWRRALPDQVTGLLVAHEWLDAVPCPVAALDRGRAVRVLVDRAGREHPGGPLPAADLAWLTRWWPPPAPPGDSAPSSPPAPGTDDHAAGRPSPSAGADGFEGGWRAEVGLPRDLAWRDAVRRVRAGVAVAVDYGHLRADRIAGRYPRGTLAGYRSGARVPPVPDGSRDLTAHVALDACAAAVTDLVTGTALAAQRDVLAALRVTADAPGPALADADPLAWLDAAARAGRVAELRDPAGLGGFGWLVHATGPVPLPALLPPLPPWQP